MLACGLALLLTELIPGEIDRQAVIGKTIIVSLVFFVCFYNDVLALTTVIAGAAYLIIFAVGGNALTWLFDKFIPNISAFFLFIIGKSQPDEALIKIVIFTAVLAAVTLAFLTAANLRGLPTIIIASAALVWLNRQGGAAALLRPISLCASSAVLIMAYNYSRRLFVRDMSHAPEDYLPGEELLDEGAVMDFPRSRIQIPNATLILLCLIPLVFLTAFFVLRIMPSEKVAAGYRQPAVAHAVQDASDVLRSRLGFSYNRNTFSLEETNEDPVSGDLSTGDPLSGYGPSSGYGPLSGYGPTEKIRGTVEPSGQELFAASGKGVLLLKGETFADYSGSGWYATEDGGCYRFGSALWKTRQREAVGALATTDMSATADNYPFETVSATVTLLYDTPHLFVPTPLYTIDNDIDVCFDDYGNLFPRSPLKAGTRYTVTAPRLISYGTEAQAYFAEQAAGAEDNLTVASLYGEKPGDCTNYVSTIVGEITEGYGENDEFAKAAAIRQYLLDNCRYTYAAPQMTAGYTDITEFFLKTNSGHSQHFATAMVIMARHAGIPARYVEGYRLISDGGTVTATGKNAGAWAELWFNGVGWVAFDLDADMTADTLIGAIPTINDLSKTTESNRHPISFFLWTLLAVLLIFAAAIGLYLLRFSSRHMSRTLERRERVLIWWEQIVYMLKDADPSLAKNGSERQSEYYDRLSANRDLSGVVLTVGRCKDTAFVPSADSAEYVYQYHRRLIFALLKKQTPFVFAVKYAILPAAKALAAKIRTALSDDEESS